MTKTIQANELILNEKVSLLKIIGYRGVCHSCNSPVVYEGEMNTLVLEDNKDTIRVLVLDMLTCPFCETIVNTILVYKSLEVSKELVTHD